MARRIAVRLPRASQQSGNAPCLLARAFTTTSNPQALGPESPNYIEVPKPVQPTFARKPIVKGVLPVPRNIFQTRSSLPKESDEFISKSTPEPKNQRQPPEWSKDAEYILYKRRLADIRRQSLREGVKQLYQRKVESERELAAKSHRIQEYNKALAMAPPRETDVLTSASISKTIRDFLDDSLPSTSRQSSEQRLEAFRRRQQRHTAVRQSHLHDLYTHARDFIVDEAALDAAIEKEFGTEEKPIRWNRTTGEPDSGLDGVGESPWAAGAQHGVLEQLNKLKAGESIDLAQERIRKVAEELTGGRM
jgi:hypothetical protein